MGLLGDGTVGHGAGLKTGNDILHTLHFFNGNGLFRIAKIHQSPEIFHRVFCIDQRGVLFEQFVVAPLCGLL